MADRPLPRIGEDNRAFWTGGADGVLRIMRCNDCGYWLHPPGPICPKCLSEDIAPKRVSGDGVIASFTINHQQWMPGLATPYVIALVELVEQTGLRLTTNIVDAAPDTISIGQRVSVVFVDCGDVHVPLFRPVSEMETKP